MYSARPAPWERRPSGPCSGTQARSWRIPYRCVSPDRPTGIEHDPKPHPPSATTPITRQAVFTVGRRPLDVAADPRLHQLVLPTLDDMDKDQDTIKQLQGSVDIAIIALGTTRSAAGDAAAFKKVDVEYVAAAARLSKASGAYRYRDWYLTRPTGAHSLTRSLAHSLTRSLAHSLTRSLAHSPGVRSLGLVSAQGANANIWANDMKLFHGLLYARSKGEAEALVLVGVHLDLRALTHPAPTLTRASRLPFARSPGGEIWLHRGGYLCSRFTRPGASLSLALCCIQIARPGLMNRGTAARLGEKMGAWILPSVPAEQVARQLIRATIRGLDGGVEVGGRVDVIEMRDLKAPVA